MYDIYKKLLDEKKLKNADVSRATGISNMTLSDWKRGVSQPKMDKMQKIADYLEVSVDYLMTGEEKENKIPIFEYSSDIMELIKLYSQLNKEQKDAILNMMRSFALNN
jgi:transcriptional regulator with XRE-family HTH domain